MSCDYRTSGKDMMLQDSFENIIADSRRSPCAYAHRRGTGPINRTTCIGCMFGNPTTCLENMQRDLVRRCKELAEEPCGRCEAADDKREGGHVDIGKVATFPGAKADKAQALKVLEEAAEVFGAWQAYDEFDPPHCLVEPVLDECADVIQAACNLIAALGVADFAPNMEECRERNEERGRL